MSVQFSENNECALRALDPAAVERIKRHPQISESIVVALATPAGFAIAGMRKPRAVVLLKDPAHLNRAQAFKDFIDTCSNVFATEIMMPELVGGLDEISHGQRRHFVELLSKDSWCHKDNFDQLKTCEITVCESLTQVREYYPENPCDLIYLGEAKSCDPRWLSVLPPLTDWHYSGPAETTLIASPNFTFLSIWKEGRHIIYLDGPENARRFTHLSSEPCMEMAVLSLIDMAAEGTLFRKTGVSREELQGVVMGCEEFESLQECSDYFFRYIPMEAEFATLMDDERFLTLDLCEEHHGLRFGVNAPPYSLCCQPLGYNA